MGYPAVSPSVILRKTCVQNTKLRSNIAVIPKSNNPSRLAQNLDVLGFDLEESEIEAISDLDKGLRFNDPGFYLPNHPLRIFG
jgi:D-xylose reductase